MVIDELAKKTFSTSSNTVISVIVLTHQFEEIVEESIRKIHDAVRFFENYEIVIVENGSTDQTLQKLKEIQKLIPQIRILVLSQEYSSEVALSAGLDSCIGDYIVMLNLLTDPGKIISDVVNKLDSGNDIVFAKYSVNSALSLTGMNKFLVSLIQKISPHDFLFSLNYCTGFNRKALNALLRVKRKKRYLGYINSMIGYQRSTVYYDPISNNINKLKKITPLRILSLFFDASVTNSFRPLRFVTLLGAAASFLNFLYILYVFGVTIVKKNIAEGWITTSLIIGTMFFILFGILVIISEYLIRVLDEVRQEPAYFIAEEFDNALFISHKERLNIV